MTRKHYDETKEFDRIGVWPASDTTDDPHKGDHYVYSWGEAENRVKDYITL